MKEIIISPNITSFCYIDDDNNMIDITDKIPYRLLQFVKKTKFLFGDDIILDRALVKKHNEAQTIVEQCKTRAIQIQAIMEDRRSEVVIPDTPPAPPVAPPPVP